MTESTMIAGVTDTPFVIAGRTLRSRLMVGTGKYRSADAMVRALDASGAEVVTVAVRRVDLNRSSDDGVLPHIDPTRYFLLSNTAGCYSAAVSGRSVSLSPITSSFTHSLNPAARARRA